MPASAEKADAVLSRAATFIGLRQRIEQAFSSMGCGSSKPAPVSLERVHADWAAWAGPLNVAIEAPSFILGSALIALAERQAAQRARGEVIELMPRCQDWPASSCATTQQIRAKHPCQVVVLSICWLDRNHPDRYGEQLARLACFFRAKMRGEDANQSGEFFVLWDYCSLPQKRIDGKDDRTAEDKTTFKKILRSINVFYAHPCTTVFLCTRLPSDLSRYGNSTPYHGRGWTVTEKTLASISTDSWLLLDVGAKFDGAWLPALEHLSWYTIFSVCRGSRSPPLPPAAFAKFLADGVQATPPTIKFTNAADIEPVTEQYRLGFLEQIQGAVQLAYGGAGWGDTEVRTMCDALESTNAARLRELRLWGNHLTDMSAQRLSALVASGSLPRLGRLDLKGNPISEAGQQALMAACQAAGVAELVFGATAAYKPHMEQALALIEQGQGETPGLPSAVASSVGIVAQAASDRDPQQI